MTAAQIEHRLNVLYEMQAKERDASTLATLARSIEYLILLDPDQDEGDDSE